MEKGQETIILAAISESFITDNTIAIDATHFEARDKAPAKKENQKLSLKSGTGKRKKNVNNG